MARLANLAGAVLLLSVLPGAQQGKQAGPGQIPSPVNSAYWPDIDPSISALQFGAVASGGSEQLTFELINRGLTSGSIAAMRIDPGVAGNGFAWTVEVGGAQVTGADTRVSVPVGLEMKPGESATVTVTFAPTEEQYDAISLVFSGDFDDDASGDPLFVELTGLGGHSGDPFLHVVINTAPYFVDWSGNGVESVFLDGSTSHTHEPGHSITSFEWTQGGMLIGTDPFLSQELPVGSHDLTLEIFDDGSPQRRLSDSVSIEVVSIRAIPGVLARYYDAGPYSPANLLKTVPGAADFGEILPTSYLGQGNTVGSSDLSLNTMVQLVGDLLVEVPGTYVFEALGGRGSKLFVRGRPIVGPLRLPRGRHQIEGRFAIENAATDLPVSIQYGLVGGSAATPDPELITHDQLKLHPIINTMPTLGIDLGGNEIVIEGLGFFPAGALTVHWGDSDLTLSDFDSIGPNEIRFESPPGTGTIPVTIETPAGFSNTIEYQYSPTGPVPVKFQLALQETVPQATAGVVGPDGKLYVVTNQGDLHAIEFADDYSSVVSHQVFAGISGLSNHNALGIAVSPFDPPSPVKLYIGHGEHFLNGGSSFVGPSDYTGQVSVLTGPNFDAPVPLITGLPTSNHDHAVNGLVFDNNGDLYVAVGSNTNAGVRHPNSGDLPESPLSAAILKARTSKSGFNGAVTYTHSTSGMPSTDQVEGEEVDVDPGSDVFVYATGVRNPFGLVFTTRKRLYSTDNGPNVGFGAASTGPSSEVSDPSDSDELNLIEYGVYYGAPNRARGRYDDRENVYYGSQSTGPMPSIPGVFRQMLSWVPPSTDGIDEYRADTFQGQMRGWLLVQGYLNALRRIELSPDGRSSLGQIVMSPWTGALSVVGLPGGSIAAIAYNQARVQVLEPDDLSAVGLTVLDVFPWRAPATGGYPFTLGGTGFGNLGNTSVTIGGLAATLTSVSATRIEGVVPFNGSPTKDLVDIVVTVGMDTDTLPDAFRYLYPEGMETGEWFGLSSAPVDLGEVSAAVIDGILYVLGEGAGGTYRYDLYGGSWLSSVASRPLQGHHHSAEVVDDKLYLIGGLGGSSEGKVQIYDPATNSWSLGADMSWAAGSLSTCVIDGKIYAAGGVVGISTVANCSVYDPGSDSWTALLPMPLPRNHAAAGTDGERFWIFGGRTGGNFVTNGFDQVQVFDPVTSTWETSDDMGSSLQPLPIGRGGTGKAVYYQREFYVFGGETLNGPGATPQKVYNRVDVYDPCTDTWRLDEPMRRPRHGTHPILFEGGIFLPGGGEQSGFSQSDEFDVFSRL